ncbi:MAG: aminopeptidase P N-terminal domain-containing protein [Acidobacteria bacterium]|nr:aminopeptidase P N-terminal domain-containing protein [Acidobacteriota bacterium]
MSFMKPLRRRTVVLTLALLTLAFPILATSQPDSKNASSVIRLAPPAPVISDEARLAEFNSRRARVAEKIGPTGILVLFSGEPRVYTNDVDYEFRQENNLYYLTGLKQKGATLVMMPGNTEQSLILFLPRRDPAAETWTGHMYSPEEAQRISGVGEIWEASEFEPFMKAVRARQPYRPQASALLMSGKSSAPVASQTPQGSAVGNNAAATPARPTGYETLYAAAGQGEAELYLLMPRETESREFRQEQNFSSQWAKTSSGFSVRDAWPIFIELRLHKSPMELQFMQHAMDITAEALGRAMSVAGRSAWEYEIEAQVDYTFKLRNADNWGYPSIVGCGPNATTLHYEESQGRVRQGDLILMDVGAEYEHYSADITRTFPINGKFTPAQADIYNIVFAAQEAAARAMRPGATLTDVHNASLEVLKDGLLRLGLITDKSSNQYRIWYMHGNSHFLGMNVHDVGMRSTKLEVGMTFTNEPGIYIREDALDYLPKTPENEKFIAAVRPAFEKYKNIGVRIEDDMLIAPDGVKWMTAAIPRTIQDIEAFMAKASREMK